MTHYVDFALEAGISLEEKLVYPVGLLVHNIRDLLSICALI